MEAPALQLITGWTALRSRPAVLKDSVVRGPGLEEELREAQVRAGHHHDHFGLVCITF